ncbi:MAG: transposase [Bacteroidales bacterium]
MKQLFPTEPKGNFARQLTTLAAMVAGIVQARSCQLPAIAHKTPDRAKADSRIKRYSRWVQNEWIEYAGFYLPFVSELLSHLAAIRELVFVIDGSEVGHECITLMISLIYGKRALPITWLVVKGRKGHLSEAIHLDLLAQLQAILPENCRTAKNMILYEDGRPFSFAELFLQVDDQICIPQVWFTKEGYGPVTVIAQWERGFACPLYLVTNFELPDEAVYWYKKRFQIETFFSDEKSRGFFLHKSHLADPQRLSNLMIAACLAYLWIVYLGCVAVRDDWVKTIHRTDRCDWSLFRLGLALLDHFLNELIPIPVSFNLLEKNCVR